LRDRLLLADRGYPGVEYFEAVAAHGGAFITRLTRNYDPWVRAAWVDGHRVPVAKGRRLSRWLVDRRATSWTSTSSSCEVPVASSVASSRCRGATPR
jgi:hypothetical protein